MDCYWWIFIDRPLVRAWFPADYEEAAEHVVGGGLARLGTREEAATW
jgi:hypothetical protein